MTRFKRRFVTATLAIAAVAIGCVICLKTELLSYYDCLVLRANPDAFSSYVAAFDQPRARSALNRYVGISGGRVKLLTATVDLVETLIDQGSVDRRTYACIVIADQFISHDQSGGMASFSPISAVGARESLEVLFRLLHSIEGQSTTIEDRKCAVVPALQGLAQGKLRAEFRDGVIVPTSPNPEGDSGPYTSEELSILSECSALIVNPRSDQFPRSVSRQPVSRSHPTK